jgi:hypothetical protein
MGFVVVASEAAGAAGAGGAAAERETRTAGALRTGGATGVVAMTWISGSFELPLALEASCAATVLNLIASTTQNAQSNRRTVA